MRPRTPARTSAFILGATAAALLCACVSTTATPVIALPNGFYLQPDKSSQIGLVKRGGKRVLPGPIAAYAVSRYIVSGALGDIPASALSCTNDCPFRGGPETKYFVLNTETGMLDSDLDEETWRQRLAAAGVSPPFEIYAPVLGCRANRRVLCVAEEARGPAWNSIEVTPMVSNET